MSENQQRSIRGQDGKKEMEDMTENLQVEIKEKGQLVHYQDRHQGQGSLQKAGVPGAHRYWGGSRR